MYSLKSRKKRVNHLRHTISSRRFFSLLSVVVLLLLLTPLLSTFVIQGKEEHRPNVHRNSLLPVPMKRYPAAGALIIVNSLEDGVPANDGKCTLREALLNVNARNQSGSTDCAAGSGTDMITFNTIGTINLTGPLPDLSKGVTINGFSPQRLEVRRNTGGDYRIFTVGADQETVTISGLKITNGKMMGDGGGVLNRGGGLVLENCVIAGNSGNLFGGGVALDDEQSTVIKNCTIANNSVGGFGGGLSVRGLGYVTIENCTISDNTGGGLFFEHVGFNTSLSNCTISGNYAPQSGSAVLNQDEGNNESAVLLSSCTIVNNRTGNGGGVITTLTRALGDRADIELENTLVAANQGKNFVAVGKGRFVSRSNNLDSDGSSNFSIPADRVPEPGTQINARLGPLADNGGLTMTHALLPDSPAVDAGAITSGTDQRGVPRPQNARGAATPAGDIGAYELRTPRYINATLGNDNNNGLSPHTPFKTIAKGILEASRTEVEVLVLASSVYRENNLAISKIITRNLSITGTTAQDTIIDGQELNRIFSVAGDVTLNLNRLTITHGKTASGQDGGGMTNYGTLNLNDCVVVENQSGAAGGGISNFGTLGVNGSRILKNQSGAAGSGISNSGPLTINNSTISDHSGLGIYNSYGALIITNSTLIGNSLKNRDAMVTLTNSTFSGSVTIENIASLNPATISMLYCTVKGGTLKNTKAGAAVAGFSFKNTILSGASLSGEFTSQGYNLASDNGGGFLTADGDQINQDARLDTLANNGGPTLTHALLPGSPAIDAVRRVEIPRLIITDQRGRARSVARAEDIGAFESRSIFVNIATGNDSYIGDQSFPLKTITKAVAQVLDGDALFLAAGRYEESGLIITKNIRMIGEGVGQTIIDGKQLNRVLNFRSGFAHLSNLTVTGGKVADDIYGGGGILAVGDLTLDNCAIVNNSETKNKGGGGISLINSNATITGCTLSGNSAGGGGGGILFSTITGTSLKVVNSTLSGNSASGQGVGGGILSAGNLEVINSTIANNTGTSCGGIDTLSIDAGLISKTTLRNTIVAHNSLPNLRAEKLFTGDTTTITSLGNNLTNDNGSTFLTKPGDRINQDARLGALANNGGPTQTLALLPGSPAIDAGTVTSAPTTDQRGVSRPQGNAVDIGAFEYAPRTFYVNVATGNDTNDGTSVGTSFKTIAKSFLASGTGDIISIAAGTYPENNLVISQSVSVRGAGVGQTIIDGKQLQRAFNVPVGVVATLSDLTITNGNAGNTANGGGIENLGNLTISNCAIMNNNAAVGGGIYNFGLLTITNCVVMGNNATNRGGAIENHSVLTMTGSTLSGNAAKYDAGGLVNLNEATLTNCTISGNRSNSSLAGGVATLADGGASATTSLTNCTIANNTGAEAIRTFGFTGAVSATTQLRNTLVAANNGSNFSAFGANPRLTSLGNNLDSDGTSGFVNNTKGDIVGTTTAKIDARLLPQGFYGGSTPTHLLLCDSPAINKGTTTGAPTTDQRGLPRPSGSAVDIGAVEADLSLTMNPTSLPFAGEGKAYGPVTLTATNGAGPYQFYAYNLPGWLTLSKEGVLSGTPTAIPPLTTFTFTVVAVDVRGKQICQTYSLTIASEPIISSLLPALATAGSGAITLTITGQYFNSQSQVRWNGAPRTTSYTTLQPLKATIPATDLEKVGTASITVYNANTGLTSNAVTFSIVNPATSVSGASYLGQALAPESIVSVFGAKLATGTQAAAAVPLPLTLAGTTVQVVDSRNTVWSAPLFYVSPTQINYQIPPGTAPGSATVIVRASDGTMSAGQVQVLAVAPGLFSTTSDGKGLVAAYITRVKGNGALQDEAIARFDSIQNKVVAIPIDLGPATERVILVAFGTGLRGRSSLNNVMAKIGGVNAPVEYVGPTPGYVGLDQVNLLLDRSLVGKGEVDVSLTIDGKPANIVKINIK